MIKDETSTVAVECKSTLSPNLSSGLYSAIENINPKKILVVIPADKGYAFKENIDVVSLAELIEKVPLLLKVLVRGGSASSERGGSS